MSQTYESIMTQLAGNGGFLPTPEQREVIISEAPAILVRAGAGSGKTATMTQRVAYFVASNRVGASEVLGLTFTEKAAAELAARISGALAVLGHASALERPTVATYNSLASSIAMDYGVAVGANPEARLITDGERAQLMERALRDLPTATLGHLLGGFAPQTLISSALALEAQVIDNGVELDELAAFLEREDAAFTALADARANGGNPRRPKPAASHAGWKALAAFHDKHPQRMAAVHLLERYFALKRDEGVIEFPDQIAVASRVIERIPSVREDIRRRFRLVLLDEYQDTSSGQERFLIHALADEAGQEETGRSITAVGDRNQAIYGWRGASADALDDFLASTRRIYGADRVEDLTLSVTFRNDVAILAAGNAVVHGGEESESSSRADELHPRPGAGPGRVVEVRTLYRADSYAAIARLAGQALERVSETVRTGQEALEHWRESGVGKEPKVRGGAEIAILLRARTHLPELLAALDANPATAGRYELSGGTPLLQQPEIRTIRAGLGVAVDPLRNDLLMRLLTAWNIGVEDLRALRAWSRAYARREAAKLRGGAHLNPRDEANLTEAIDAIGQADPSRFSEEGFGRLQCVAEVLTKLRRSFGLPLGDVVATAASALGQDLAAATRTAGSQNVRTSIATLVSAARNYQLTHPAASVRDLLEWLDSVDRRERGGVSGESGEDALDLGTLDTVGEVEVTPGTIQILTIHAAKGLEWRDCVIVPDLVAGGLSYPARISSWLSDASALPNPLRTDRRHLPRFDVADYHDPEVAADEAERFLEETKEWEGGEARRLAYVAFTRPVEELVVASFLATTPAALKRAAERGSGSAPDEPLVPTDISEFLSDLYEARRPRDDEAAQLNLTSAREILGGAGADIRWWDEREITRETAQALSHDEDIPDSSAVIDPFTVPGVQWWPRDVPRALPRERPLVVASSTQLADAARQLAAIAATPPDERVARPYFTATDVVHLAEEGDPYKLQLRRPIPQQPGRAVRRGSVLHARIAQFFGGAATLDIDDPEADWGFDEVSASDDELFEAFERSAWTSMRPLAIEESLEVMVDGRVVRCAVDAVFDTEGVSGRPAVTIVDWKTGRIPSAEVLAARLLQLELYRYAWSATQGTPIDQIGASFVYLAGPHGAVEHRVELRGNKEIEADIRRLIAGA